MAYPTIGATSRKIAHNANPGTGAALQQNEMPFGSSMWTANKTVTNSTFNINEDDSYYYRCKHKGASCVWSDGNYSKTPDNGSDGAVLYGGRNKNISRTSLGCSVAVNEVADLVEMSIAIYIGSTDDLAYDLTLKFGNTEILHVGNDKDENLSSATCYHNGNPKYSIPGMNLNTKQFSPAMLLKITNMNVTNLFSSAGSYDLTASGNGIKSGSGGGFDLKYLEIAVVGAEITPEAKTHTETHTETHTTTTTTTVTFPATADGVNIHAVKDGTEHLIPLYTDSDINNSPGKDIQNTVFYLGAENSGKQYKQWMALNGANHPALDPSHLYGYGHDVLGVYLKKGKDFTVEETGTYVEQVVVTLPGAG